MQVRRESYIGFDTDEGGKKEGHVKECMVKVSVKPSPG